MCTPPWNHVKGRKRAAARSQQAYKLQKFIVKPPRFAAGPHQANLLPLFRSCRKAIHIHEAQLIIAKPRKWKYWNLGCLSNSVLKHVTTCDSGEWSCPRQRIMVLGRRQDVHSWLSDLATAISRRDQIKRFSSRLKWAAVGLLEKNIFSTAGLTFS